MKKPYLLVSFALVALMLSCSTSKELESAQIKAKTAMQEAREAERELESWKERLEEVNASTDQMRQDVQELKAENNNLTQELQYTQEQLASMTRQMQAASDNYGVWFRVQIGAYEQRNIDQELETTEGMELESQDDIQKVSLGRFREYEKAKRLQEQLKSMGVTDAWIVTYKDGERVPIESVIKN